MIWKTKTSLAELTKRRGQSLKQLAGQIGLTTLEEIRTWCNENDITFDVDTSDYTIVQQQSTKETAEDVPEIINLSEPSIEVIDELAEEQHAVKQSRKRKIKQLVASEVAVQLPADPSNSDEVEDGTDQ